ncbi:MAG: MFS transporter [Rhodobacteraceae bacterium]|nr:MFS transporter [Paracoccaceae bacterium]
MIRFVRENAAFLAAGFLLTFSSSWGQTYFISLFAGQIMEEVGLTDAEWGLTYMMATTGSAVVMIFAGVLTDRFRARTLLMVVLPGLALACVGMAVNSSIAGLIVVIFALRFFGQGMASQLAIVSMARWFVASRGKALSIATMGFSVSNAVLPFIFVSLLAVITWRQSWILAAVLCLAAVPVLVRLLRLERTPQSVASENEVAGMEGRHWSRMDMLRHPLFWMAIPMLLAPPAWGTALFFQQVHFVEVKGWTLAGYTALFPIYISALIAMTFISGELIDRLGSAMMMRAWPIPWALGFVVLAAAPTLGWALVGLIFCAIGQGIQSNAPTSFFSEYYGTRHLGAIKAVATAIMVLGSALGPGITGTLITAGVGIEDQFRWISVYFVVAATFLWIGLSRSKLPTAS